jgi:4-amino-4-deoxy-L-arabinose transferase-like glycosyltransferase
MKWLKQFIRSQGNLGLLLTLLVAFGLRLAAAIVVEQKVAATPGEICLIPGDANGYWELAQRIVAGKDYSIYTPPRFVLRMPGFPLLLALSQFLFGESTFAARCLLAGVGTVACGLTYWLGRELCDAKIGLIAAIYVALSPTQILFSVLLLSETVFAVTLLASLLTFVSLDRFKERKSFHGGFDGTAMFAGMMIAVATYMRPTWLYVGPLIAVFVLCSRRGGRSTHSILISLSWLVAGVTLLLAPWIIRNYAVTEQHIVPTTLWVGPSLYDGLHPEATGDSDMAFFDREQRLSRLSEYEMDREYRGRAIAFLREHPLRSMWLAIKKQQRYWSLLPNARQFRQASLQTMVMIAVIPLFFFAACGAWLARRNFFLLAMTTGSLMLFAGLHLFFVGSLRYRLPAEYPLAILGAFGLNSCVVGCGWPFRATANAPQSK